MIKQINPFFSIIIPTYNRAYSLNKSLASLKNQTYKDFEVLVCDDGSTDPTLNIVENYKNSLNVRYFYNSNFGGPAQPRNVGLKNAKGKWVCFLDSDDTYKPNRLEELKKLNLEEIDFIYHKLEIRKGEKIKGTIKPRKINSNKPFLDLLVNFNPIPTSSTCIRKNIFNDENFSEEKKLIGIEDYDLWLRLARKNITFHYLPKLLGIYNLGDSLTDDVQKDFTRMLYLFEKHEKFVQKKERHLFHSTLNFHKALIHFNLNENNKVNKIILNLLFQGNFRLFFKLIKLFYKNNFM